MSTGLLRVTVASIHHRNVEIVEFDGRCLHQHKIFKIQIVVNQARIASFPIPVYLAQPHCQISGDSKSFLGLNVCSFDEIPPAPARNLGHNTHTTKSVGIDHKWRRREAIHRHDINLVVAERLLGVRSINPQHFQHHRMSIVCIINSIGLRIISFFAICAVDGLAINIEPFPISTIFLLLRRQQLRDAVEFVHEVGPPTFSRLLNVQKICPWTYFPRHSPRPTRRQERRIGLLGCGYVTNIQIHFVHHIAHRSERPYPNGKRFALLLPCRLSLQDIYFTVG